MAEILGTTESKRGVYVKNTSTEENQYTLAKYNAEEHMIYLDEAVIPIKILLKTLTVM